MGSEGGGEDETRPGGAGEWGPKGARRESGGPGSSRSGEAALDGDREAGLGRRGRRVTVDFTGPPLELPELASAVCPMDRPPSGELTLDTSEVDATAAREPTKGGQGVGEGGLDLDLSELAPKPPPAPAGADAWILDRRHRSSPPAALLEIPEVTLPPASRLPQVGPPPLPYSSAPPEPAVSITDSFEGDALGLVDRSQPSKQDLDLTSDMAERYALGDFTGALRAAELLLGISPGHTEASRYAQSSRERLEQLFSSRLGPLTRVPRVAVPEHEIRWLGLDHRAGFLLSRVDGHHTIEEVLDISGMPRLEALKTLSELVGAGAVLLGEE